MPLHQQQLQLTVNMVFIQVLNTQLLSSIKNQSNIITKGRFNMIEVRYRNKSNNLEVIYVNEESAELLKDWIKDGQKDEKKYFTTDNNEKVYYKQVSKIDYDLT